MKETEQTLLEKIKDDVAASYGWADFAELHRDNAEQYDLRMSSIVDDIANRYATAKAQASCEATLKKASEKAVFNLVNGANPNGLKAKVYTSSSVSVSIDKSSITDPSNITIV